MNLGKARDFIRRLTRCNSYFCGSEIRPIVQVSVDRVDLNLLKLSYE